MWFEVLLFFRVFRILAPVRKIQVISKVLPVIENEVVCKVKQVLLYFQGIVKEILTAVKFLL